MRGYSERISPLIQGLHKTTPRTVGIPSTCPIALLHRDLCLAPHKVVDLDLQTELIRVQFRFSSRGNAATIVLHHFL